MNKINYQKELDKITDALEGRRPRLLLHVCCAPCSSYCIEYLSAFFDITLFFYNPNIDGAPEHDKRAGELARLRDEMECKKVFDPGSVSCIILPFTPEDFEAIASGLEDVPEGGARCRKCYALRMEKAAEYAAKAGYDYFTTTLSISPLKNADWINEIGQELSERYGVKHLPSDFKKRNGYKRSVELSGIYGLYRQNYCGCSYSKRGKDEHTT